MRIEASTKSVAAAFTEWERKYREDPRAFQNDFERAMEGASCATYGDRAAAYFVKVLTEVSA